MIRLLILFATLTSVQQVDTGLAGVYNNNATLACPKYTYKKAGLPICASRDLPCGTILHVKRLDNGREARCVVADRGPYGFCTPSKKNTRACGKGSRWINGRIFIKKQKLIKSGTWRGILDMSTALARQLGVRNRVVPVLIWTDLANTEPSNIDPDDLDDPKSRNSNDISILTSLESHENHTATGQAKD